MHHHWLLSHHDWLLVGQACTNKYRDKVMMVWIIEVEVAKVSVGDEPALAIEVARLLEHVVERVDDVLSQLNLCASLYLNLDHRHIGHILAQVQDVPRRYFKYV
jgi:hypothetical protein